MSVLAEKLVLWFQVNIDPPLNDRGVLKVEDWAEICRLHRAEGMAIRAIARRLEISRNAVKKAVTSHEPPRYVRAARVRLWMGSSRRSGLFWRSSRRCRRR